MNFRIIHGVDLIEISRFQRAIRRWGDRFIGRLFTCSEIDFYKSKPSSLVSRFAAKEAVVKALGLKIKGWGQGVISWQEIEILTDNNGKPVVYLYGKVREKSEKLGISNWELSLSDTKIYALASVIGFSGISDEDC